MSPRLLIAAFFLVCVTVGGAFAQNGEVPKKPGDDASSVAETKPVDPNIVPGVKEAVARARRTGEGLKKDLAKVRKAIGKQNATIEQLLGERDRLSAIRNRIGEARSQLRNPISDLSARLDELGPAPKKGETEATSIAERRKSIDQQLNDLKAAEKQFDLLDLEASELDRRSSELQKSAFFNRVFVGRKSVLNPSLWVEFGATFPDAIARSLSVYSAWLRAPGGKGVISGQLSFVAVLAIYLAGIAGVLFVWRNMVNPPKGMRPANDLRRVWRAVGGTIVVTLLSLAAIIASIMVISFTSISDTRIPRLVSAFGEVFISVVVMVTVLRAILAPKDSTWRLINIDEASAARFFRLGLLAALVFGLDRGASAFSELTFMPLEFVVGKHALAAIALTILLAMIIPTIRQSSPLIAQTGKRNDRLFYFSWAGRFFLIAWGLVIVTVVALLLGYIAFGHFIITNVFLTATTAIGLYLVHHLADAFVVTSTRAGSRIGRVLRRNMGLGDETIRRVGLVLSTVTDLAVIAVGVPFILTLWTITWIDLRGILTKAYFGFKVGDIVVEPSRIILALVMLFLGIIAVRFFTIWLNRRILQRTTIDKGVKNSVMTGAKYTGITLVAGLSLSAAGLDFSQLAIIAGALSVGIGFGLQSVVSNFVSGLILLAERPISIGDWVIVDGGEGVVKKINVRSTEIETFDRCSVVIPNSNFISSPVTNWSLGSPVGRIKVNIGVSYDSDPEQVREIIIGIAEAHDMVVSSPPPRLMFMDFGASSLDFQLRVFLKDIDYCTSVASDLRFSIFKALKEAGIEIPFPQRDVNIRDLDKVAEAFQPKPATPRRRPAKKAARKSGG